MKLAIALYDICTHTRVCVQSLYLSEWISISPKKLWISFLTLQLLLLRSSQLFCHFFLVLTRCEEDDRQNNQGHNSQDHHHCNSYSLPVPRGTVWTSQVLTSRGTHTNTNTVIDASTLVLHHFQSRRNLSPTGISVQRASGGIETSLSETRPHWFTLIFHMRTV